MNRETKLMHQIRVAVNRTARARLVRNNNGFAALEKVKYGLGNGSPDLVGVLRCGRCFCIEVKLAGRDLDPDQKAWWRSAKQWGVLGGVAHSETEALDLLDAAEST